MKITKEVCLFYFQVFIKSELKVGVIYVKENQYTEEEILDNNENSPMFEEFLQVLGDKVRLKGNTQQMQQFFNSSFGILF